MIEMEKFPIIDISSEEIGDFEQMGTKSKFWYGNGRYLFKSIHTEDKHQRPVVRFGEDWSEKIACELAEMLGIPHASYELADFKGERGIRSENFTATGEQVVFGNSLLEYIVQDVQRVELGHGQRSQKVPRVVVILERVIRSAPKGWTETVHIKSALDVFIGYVLFDALISNQDRHNENWAMIRDTNGATFLAPSFDHAASLGRNESDAARVERLETNNKQRNVAAYVSKAKSFFYYENKRLKILRAFLQFSLSSPKASLEWLDRLEKLDDKLIKEVIERVPDHLISEISKEFCFKIIIENKQRLLALREKIEGFKP